jgi:hypothetical protein
MQAASMMNIMIKIQNGEILQQETSLSTRSSLNAVSWLVNLDPTIGSDS